MKKILLSICGILLTGGIVAQTTNLGGPMSWQGHLSGHTIVPEEVMPGFDMASHIYEDSVNDIYKAAPWNFGHKYDTDISLENSGIWTDLPNGNRLWRVGIKCDGAQTINVIFENLFIPKGAHIYLSDVDQTNRVGAYTSRNNRTDGLLGTELVHGDEIIVEYYEPQAVSGEGHFTIAHVTHGYRSLKAHQGEFLKALNSSGDCNIDVNCPLGNGWEDQIRSVAMIVVNGSGLCTGALINNTCDDGTPYFLTADHCLGGSLGNWAFRWNWDSPLGTESCATTANSVDPGPPYDQTANGATELVSGNQADHALILIDNMTVGDAQNWNLFYAGWNNDDTDGLITEATGIHHPSGDVKKICREDQNPYHGTAGGAQVWWIDDWDQGVTEPGSSGSPLFDQNGRIIGQLYGGLAACSGTNDNNEYDYYGRLGVSWGLGIGDYLAPASCGAAVTNNGWDPNTPSQPDDAGVSSVASPAGLYCVDNFVPEVTLVNYGSNNLTAVTINYDNGGPNNTFNWTGNLAPGGNEVVTLPSFTTAGGSFTFNAYTTLPNGNADTDPANDGASSNYTATIGGISVDINITTDCWGYETYWEILDASMTQVAEGGNVTVGIPPGGTNVGGNGDPGAYANEVNITETLCLSPGCYDFIIYDDYGDGLDGTADGCGSIGTYDITDASGTLATVIDPAFGNSETNNFCVQNPCNSTYDYSTTEEQCNGDDDGSITVSFLTGNSTGATYDIGVGPQASGTFANMPQGTYTVTIIDGDACASSIQVTLGGPTALSATVNPTDVSCPGDSDGSITVNATGGSSGYTYDFGAGPQGSDTDSGLSEGSYTVTVADANGCSTTASGTVGAPAAIDATITNVTHETNGNDGAINITVTGGGNLTYAWTGPNGYTSSVEDPSGLDSGLYSVTITDDCGDSFTLTDIEILDNTGLEDGEILDFVIYPNPSGGMFSIQFNGMGVSTYRIAISDIAGRIVYSEVGTSNLYDVNISNVADGTYMLTITSDVLNARKTIVIKK